MGIDVYCYDPITETSEYCCVEKYTIEELIPNIREYATNFNYSLTVKDLLFRCQDLIKNLINEDVDKIDSDGIEEYAKAIGILKRYSLNSEIYVWI